MYLTNNPVLLSIPLSMLQDGTAGDDCLSAAAATDDGGVVVGGHSNGTYNGVASEGFADFAAIKLGTPVKFARFFESLCLPHHRRRCRSPSTPDTKHAPIAATRTSK